MSKIRRPVHTLFLAASLAAAVPSAASAQGLRDAAIIFAPHTTLYSVGSGAAKRSISQTAIPLVFVLPVSERISFDITSAYSVSDVLSNGASVSTIKGLTDTQVRANFSAASSFVLFTVGLNLPTGQYAIPEGQHEAAGSIGNDFLNYPISSMGSGFAGTGGIAYARPLGNWNIGAGASMRKSTRFAAFSVMATDFRFTPSDEYRLRLSADRPVGDGQVEFGLSYSAFGQDRADTTSYASGDRVLASGSWTFPVRAADVFLSVWNLYRMEGQQFGGAAPFENVVNISGAVSFRLGGVLVQPSLETRLWQVGGVRAGNLFNAGLRTRIAAGPIQFFPNVGYSIGNLYSTFDGSATDVTGLRGSLTIRWR